MLLSLGQNEAHIWFTFSDELELKPGILQATLNLLSAEEKAQHQRYSFEKGRRNYLMTRALVRSVLSRYIALDPRDWEFQSNPYGRPEIAKPKLSPPLRFNLSHTDGLIVCGLTWDREIGVDVENRQRRTQTVEVAQTHFSVVEIQEFLELSSEQQHKRFFEYWTLKEAYIKARGFGLSLPLSQFSFHLEENQPIRISFDPGLIPEFSDNPALWQFQLSELSLQHQMAIAIRKGNGPGVRYIKHQIDFHHNL